MTGSGPNKPISRRDFLRWLVRAAGVVIATPFLQACQRLGLIEVTETATETASPPVPATRSPVPTVTISPQTSPTLPPDTARITFVRTRDRADGVRRAIALLDSNSVMGTDVLLKPNFNSADPAPASTHPDTLRSIITNLKSMGASSITVADRSGMGNTRQVFNRLGAFDLAEELGFDTLAFDELSNADEWMLINVEGSHWKNGFPIPQRVLDSGAIVQTCCLKPHRFGGHFTLSLKNSVGLVGKYRGRGGYNYMGELHNSQYQRLMIAEINAVYTPALVVLDGIEAFIDKGPERGTKVWGDVVLAGTDRVAVDAVGLALLRYLGYTGVAANGPIFAQEQIARAVELNLGVDGPDKITFITDDSESAAYAEKIRELMLQSG